MLKRTGTKQRTSDDRTTNLSRLIIIGNLRIDLFSVATVRRGTKNGSCGVVGKQQPVNPKCGLRVECVGNRHHDDAQAVYRYSTA